MNSGPDTGPAISWQRFQQLASAQGLHAFGLTCDLRVGSEQMERFEAWQEEGYAGSMSYMLRDSKLFADLRQLLPSAKSAVFFTVHYSRRPAAQWQRGYGRIARYAWGRDYHRVLRKRLRRLTEELESELPTPLSYRVFTDAVPLLERHFANKAGLGFVGKNSMLIQPGKGSYFFVAELLSNLKIEDSSLNVLKGSCGTCSRCMDQCPTDAIVEEGTIDARRCISYLTIEKSGRLSLWERKALGKWIFGCDLCQDCCPFNHRSLKREEIADIEDFEARDDTPGILSLSQLLKISNAEEFQERFAGRALMRAGREGLLRNALAVAVNTKVFELAPYISDSLESESSAVLREMYLWALDEFNQLGEGLKDPQLRRLAEAYRGDDDKDVSSQAESMLARL